MEKRTLFVRNPLGLHPLYVRTQSINIDPSRKNVDVGKTLESFLVTRTLVVKFEIGCSFPPGDSATFSRDTDSLVSDGEQSCRQ